MGIPAEYYIFKITILKRVFLIAAALSMAAFLLGQKGFSFGFLIGALLSMAIFLLMYRYLLAARGLRAARRKNFLMIRSLLLYLLMAAALFIGIKKGIGVFLGTAAGLLTLKMAVFIEIFRGRHAGT